MYLLWAMMQTHKHQIMTKKLFLTAVPLLLSLVTIAQTITWQSTPISIFSECNFESFEKALTSSISFHDSLNYWDDQIASISIDEGWKAVVYENYNWKGDSLVLTGNWSALHADDFWANNISSIRLIYTGQIHRVDPPMEQIGITLFMDSYWRGPTLTIYEDWTVDDSGHFDELISAISIPEGWEIIAYEHPNFSGTSRRFTEDWTITKTREFWNDRISSIRIIKR